MAAAVSLAVEMWSVIRDGISIRAAVTSCEHRKQPRRETQRRRFALNSPGSLKIKRKDSETREAVKLVVLVI